MIVKTKLKKAVKSPKGNPKKKLNSTKYTKKTAKAKKTAKTVSKKTYEMPTMDNNDETLGEEMLEMVDEEDLSFLKTAVNNTSYSILKKVHIPETLERTRKRKLKVDLETIEEDYESKNELKPKEIKMKNLLPIKTKSGIVRRTATSEKETNEFIEAKVEDMDDEGSNDSIEKDENMEGNGSDKDSTADENEMTRENDLNLSIGSSEPITPAQLLIARNKALEQKKIHIGTLSSGLIESPEEKIDNFKTLLKLLEDKTCELYVSVRKLVIVALLEVFKDILPSYLIKLQDNKGIKLKKETLRLHKYEEHLVGYYKKYLQALEKIAGMIRKKQNGRNNLGERSLGEVAVHAMCDLLIAHPYFNYSENLAQAIVPFLNNPNKNVREITSAAMITVFREDKKEEITLKILRSINHYLKTHSHNVNTDMLEILLSLRIKDINLDNEKEIEIKSKKLNAHKQNILAKSSKKEKKRKKRLQELEKELMETKAEENKQSKLHNLTEITKVLFGIYFRILKSSTNTKILAVCLEGLAKFAHCINLEFYVDIVNVLDKLLEEDWLGHREKLHCILTVFAILGGQGDALNLDPTRFYVNLYKDLLHTDASRSHVNFSVLLHTVVVALIQRRKRITNKRVVGFLKRLVTLSLQLLHGSSLGCLAVVKTVMQLSKAADILLDVDNSVGDGKYNAELDDPEYCNASCTSLYELVPLFKHYNPIVTKYAMHIAAGVPASGEGSLPPLYGKCSPEELYKDFDMSEMAFNPPIPVPKKVQAKAKASFHRFTDDGFRRECLKNINFTEQCNLTELLFVI